MTYENNDRQRRDKELSDIIETKEDLIYIMNKAKELSFIKRYRFNKMLKYNMQRCYLQHGIYSMLEIYNHTYEAIR